MTVRPASTPQSNPSDGNLAAESTYRALSAASQAKVFQNILNQMQAMGDESNSQELNSLLSEIQRLQNPQTAALEAGTLTSNGTLPISDADTAENPLATALLLSLSAVSGNKAGIDSLYSGSLGTYTDRGTGGRSVSSTSSHQNVPRSSGNIGALAARFESGENGTAAIGYDEKGGTSYGTYQIASRVGTMRQFLEYLEGRDPKLAARLKAAGPADTGGTGGNMPAVWKQIASENPGHFATLQHDFIKETHYEPALQEIYQRTGLNVETQGRAMKEVLWSTSVQHGSRGAANIFCNAIEQSTQSGSNPQAKDMIESIYSSRAGQFGGSSPGIRASVQGRFRQEKLLALAMLGQREPTTNATA